MKRTLRQRYGKAGQMERYRMELISGRREKNENMRSMLTDIRRLIALAHPGQHGQLGNILIMSAFLTPLGDQKLEMKIRKIMPNISKLPLTSD